MKTLAFALPFIFCSLSAFSQETEKDSLPNPYINAEYNYLTGCGVERWSIKTLTDPDTMHINFDLPVRTTIADIARQSSDTIHETSPRQAAESEYVIITAYVYAYKVETDQDFHLLLRDPQTDSLMVAEIPDPTCADVIGTRHAPEYAIARKWVEDSLGTPKASFTYLTAPRTITLTGIPFEDFAHNQTGRAANGFEIHPVLSIRFGTVSGIQDEHGRLLKLDLSDVVGEKAP